MTSNNWPGGETSLHNTSHVAEPPSPLPPFTLLPPLRRVELFQRCEPRTSRRRRALGLLGKFLDQRRHVLRPNRRSRVGSTPKWSLFVSGGSRWGGAHRAGGGGGGAGGSGKCQCWCCYCESGLELGFSLLARGSRPPNLNTEEGGESSQSRLFFDLDFWPPVA